MILNWSSSARLMICIVEVWMTTRSKLFSKLHFARPIILLTLCRIVTKSKHPLLLQLIALSLGQSNWAHAIQGSGPIKFVGLFLPNLCKTSSCPVVNAENQDYNSMRSSFQLHFPVSGCLPSRNKLFTIANDRANVRRCQISG